MELYVAVHGVQYLSSPKKSYDKEVDSWSVLRLTRAM